MYAVLTDHYMIHKELISGCDDGPLSLSGTDRLSAERQDHMELTEPSVLHCGFGDSIRGLLWFTWHRAAANSHTGEQNTDCNVYKGRVQRKIEKPDPMRQSGT